MKIVRDNAETLRVDAEIFYNPRSVDRSINAEIGSGRPWKFRAARNRIASSTRESAHVDSD